MIMHARTEAEPQSRENDIIIYVYVMFLFFQMIKLPVDDTVYR
jgi:hypothetical protein